MFSHKLQLFILLGLMIMFIPFISSFEFDNVKSYDAQTKTATITNAFGLGNKIADVQLKSEQNVQVGLGYQKVFEYEIDSKTDYSSFIKETEIYNMKRAGTQENKQIDLKYLVSKDVEKQNFTYDCDKNGKNCKYVDLGKYKVKEDVWEDLKSMDIKTEKIIISGWTEVQQGDFYEWMPNFAGIQVNEWATWSGNLSTGLLSYWKLDSNTTEDVMGANDGTNAGAVNITGKIQYAKDFDGGGQHISVGTGTIALTDGNWTMNMWINPDGSGECSVLGVKDGTVNGYLFGYKGVLGLGKAGVNEVWGTQTIKTGSWSMVTLTYDTSANIVHYFINGTDYGDSDAYSSTFAGGLEYYLGGHAGSRWFAGGEDEIGVWTRVLSQSEITLLYNNYTGCQYGNETCYGILDAPPTITQNSPADASTSNIYANTFSCTGTDNIKVQNISFYVNGTINQTNTSVFNNSVTSFTTSLEEGYYNWSCEVWDNATIPQSAIATRTLTVSIGSPTVALYSPIDVYNSTDKDMSFICNVSDGYGVANVSLMLNNSINQTNTSGFNNTNYTFNVPLADGYYNWSCNAKNINSKSATAVYRVFTINTVPIISITPPPYNTSNYSTSSVDIEATSSFAVDYWIINYNGTNITITGQSGTSLLEPITVADGSYRLLLYANNSDSGVWGLNNTIYFNVDTTKPAINITSPLATLNYQAINTNLTVNWTVTDAHLDKCWYNYKGTNTTVTCGDNTTNINITDWLNKNLTFWANDTYGNYNSTFFSWNYRLFFISETYSSSVLEGSSTPFSTLLVTNGTDITIANLSYNGGSYLGSISQSGNNFSISRTLSVPTVTANTNKSFFWKITQADGFVYNYTAKNQTVVNFGIDNCSVNGNVLYNFTIVDEKTQTEINETGSNSLAQINLQMYAYGTTTSVLSFNSNYNQVNPFAVCINNSIGNETYSLDAQVKYQADGYEQEFYHIQNSTIGNSSFTTNITLYDLNTTNSQVFKLIYKDASYLPVYNALIVVGRKYIDEGVFKNVEIPKTDVQGETVAHLVLNDVVYNFTMIQNGVILGTFDNLFAVCQTPLVSECIIEFNSFAGEVGVPDFDAEKDFSYSLGYLNTTRTIQSNFTIPSGTPSTVTLTVKSSDALGTAICTDTLTSASGTLSCVVPASIGNSTVYASLYKNGGFVGWGNLKLNQRPQDIYGDSVMVFISVISMMVLIGIAISGNGVVTVILLALGLIVLFALNIVANNGFLGKTATILWILIALVLILIRKGRR